LKTQFKEKEGKYKQVQGKYIRAFLFRNSVGLIDYQKNINLICVLNYRVPVKTGAPDEREFFPRRAKLSP